MMLYHFSTLLICCLLWNILAEIEGIKFSTEPLDFDESTSRGMPVPPDDGNIRPFLLRFVNDSTSEELCHHFAMDDDFRCQIVQFNWYWIRKEFSVYQFRFGKLQFFAHRWRMYRTGDCDLVEFMVRFHLLRALYSHAQQLTNKPNF